MTATSQSYGAVLGEALDARQAGRFAEGLKHYERALELQPDFPDAAWDRAVEAVGGNRAAALRTLGRACTLGPVAPAEPAPLDVLVSALAEALARPDWAEPACALASELRDARRLPNDFAPTDDDDLAVATVTSEPAMASICPFETPDLSTSSSHDRPSRRAAMPMRRRSPWASTRRSMPCLIDPAYSSLAATTTSPPRSRTPFAISTATAKSIRGVAHYQPKTCANS